MQHTTESAIGSRAAASQSTTSVNFAASFDASGSGSRVIAVPAAAAQAVVNTAVDAGIKAVLKFVSRDV